MTSNAFLIREQLVNPAEGRIGFQGEDLGDYTPEYSRPHDLATSRQYEAYVGDLKW
jgi:hypothetical protein